MRSCVRCSKKPDSGAASISFWRFPPSGSTLAMLSGTQPTFRRSWGGIDADSTAVVQVLYEQVVSTVVPVSSPRVAEMVKLLENTFRAVNIGLVNELALMSHRLGVDVWEVIEAANTKPFGFTPFCGVITTQHPQFDCQAIAARSACLVDTRNALKGLAGSHIHRL